MTQKCTAAAVRGSPQVQSRRKRRRGCAGELSWDHPLRYPLLSIDLERKASSPIFLKPWERDEKVRSCQFLPQSSPLAPSPCQPMRNFMRRVEALSNVVSAHVLRCRRTFNVVPWFFAQLTSFPKEEFAAYACSLHASASAALVGRLH